MKKLYVFLFSLFTWCYSSGQVVYTSPVFPSDADTATVYFNAAQGNAALKGYNDSIWAHTGVLTNLSTTPSDWRYVGDVWGKGNPVDAKFLMTKVGTDLYSIKLNGIRSFYGVPASETILKLAFVFRNKDGSIVGRNADGSDIFYDVWDGVSLLGKFLQPTSSLVFANKGSVISCIYVTSRPCNISLYINNVQNIQFVGTDSLNLPLTITDSGITVFKMLAVDSPLQHTDSFTVAAFRAVTVAPLPAGVDDGINYVDDSTVTLVLVAPHKKNVYVIGDFTNWIPNYNTYMNMTPDSSRWWITLQHLVPRQEYAYEYLVDNILYIADPYCDKVLDPANDPYIPDSTYPNLKPYPVGAHGIVSVLQTAQTPFIWHDGSYIRPDYKNLTVYELLIRDFVSVHNYQTVMDSLHYLKNLGINAIELMPVSEFEGNDGWGYNPNFYFAIDKYYGTKDALKTFIDSCHHMGIAVIQDIVLDHMCGSSPLVQLYANSDGWPTADNPWFNADADPVTPGYQAPHPYGVCYDVNWESDYSHKLVDDVLKYWNQQYHIDGWRFDLSSGFTNTYTNKPNDPNAVANWQHYDQSRVDNISRMATQIRTVDPNVYLILEHFVDYSEDQALANTYNCMPWAKLSDNFDQCGMGYVSGSDISWLSYKSHGFNLPRAVGYMESHDEERAAYKIKTYGNYSSTYNVRPLDTMIQRLKLNALFFFPVPGPHMIWQFGELGYDYSIDYCTNGSINSSCRIDDKPIRWDYFQNNQRRSLYYFYKSLIALRNTYPVFQTTAFSLTAGDNLLKTIHLTDSLLDVTIIGNFDVKSNNITPGFQHTGEWFNYFTGDSVSVSDVNAPMNLEPGGYAMFTDHKLPPPVFASGIHDPVIGNQVVLQQNVPNPFSNQTSIDFYLPAGGNVQMQVLDLSGRMVEMIAHRYYGEGWYTVDFNSSHLQNGTYICRLTEGKMNRVIKMIVVK